MVKPMIRSLLILLVVAGTSLALTWYFGEAILLALGLILLQAKVFGQKLMAIQWPAVLAWLKLEATNFFRIELLKKWMMTSLLPLLVGKALLNRIEAWFARYREMLATQYDELLGWYDGLEWYEKTIAALIVLFATLALSVTSLGLWLILFSVKLPFWLLAAFSALGRMTWESVRRMVFKALAFLQLGWLWRILRRRLPPGWLERKRRFDYRVARAVVRKRRMTLKQLAEGQRGLSLRMAILRETLRQWRGLS